jgi:iron complex transport system substrate-binding protein
MHLTISWRRLPPLLLLSVLAACRSDASRGQRVVGVSKQINEYLFEIGAESVLVARDLTSVFPDEITRLPSVGYHRALSAEGILSMKPTLVLTDGNVGPDAVLAQVRAVGVPVEIMAPGSSVDSAQALMIRLGQRFHHERKADSVVAAWRAGMDLVRTDSALLGGAPPPRVLLMHFGQINNSYLAVKRGGPADQLVRLAGGVNAVDSAGGMLRLTPELIAKLAPDVIIATDVGFDRAGGAAGFAAMPGVSLTPAAKSGRIHRVDEHDVMYFGPRSPAAVRTIASWLRAPSALGGATATTP